MRVMSFNLRADNFFDIGNRWAKRSHIVYEVLENYDCDIVGFQEVTELMHKDIRQNIIDYLITGRRRCKRYFSERNSLLVSKRHKVLNTKTFWLSNKPNQEGSRIWYAILPRICTMATVRLEDGREVRVYNTHLDFLLPKARMFQLKRLIEQIEINNKKEKRPYILMGDFNATPDSKLIKALRENQNTKTKFIAVQDYDTTLYDVTTMSMFVGKQKGLHIDYIFVSEEFEIENVEIVKYNKSNKYPSDHYPLVADLKLV